MDNNYLFLNQGKLSPWFNVEDKRKIEKPSILYYVDNRDRWPTEEANYLQERVNKLHPYQVCSVVPIIKSMAESKKKFKTHTCLLGAVSLFPNSSIQLKIYTST